MAGIFFDDCIRCYTKVPRLSEHMCLVTENAKSRLSGKKPVKFKIYIKCDCGKKLSKGEMFEKFNDAGSQSKWFIGESCIDCKKIYNVRIYDAKDFLEKLSDK